jgi:hypothetical protein
VGHRRSGGAVQQFDELSLIRWFDGEDIDEGNDLGILRNYWHGTASSEGRVDKIKSAISRGYDNSDKWLDANSIVVAFSMFYVFGGRAA